MDYQTSDKAHQAVDLADAIQQAIQGISPAWPLAATVAVNPFLGQTDRPLAETAEQLVRLTGLSPTMPRAWYARKIDDGAISEADLAEALSGSPFAATMSVLDLRSAAGKSPSLPQAIPTIAQLAREVSGIDWPRLVDTWIGTFAAGYFDEGQALWPAPRDNGLYAAWRLNARHDLSPEIAGLHHFARHADDLPRVARHAITGCAMRLGLGGSVGTYFQQLLLDLGGWAQHARHLSWQAERDGHSDDTIVDLLAVRLAFEAVLHRQYETQIEADWSQALARHRAPVVATQDREIDSVLQAAAERAEQRRVAAALKTAGKTHSAGVTNTLRPALQAAFCIDVRSEVFRRALESADGAIETLGFAGFFGLGIGHRDTASDLRDHRLPVLIAPRLFTCTEVGAEADRAARIRSLAVRAFGRFKQAAVSSFAFVEATGPAYAWKLVASALHPARRKPAAREMPRFSELLDLERKVTMAVTVLKAMSLTERFARIVLLCGHGASVTNNPMASALQCGACGGHAGDVNARLLASLLNEGPVRQGLGEHGIAVPEDTVFLAGLHDTTTDDVTLYDADSEAGLPGEDLSCVRQWLATAGRLARAERSRRLPHASERSLAGRARDWAEVRPEWGLAGCSTFIAAPRDRTADLSLDGRAFLHDYAWQRDGDFSVLELILTAPVVVASWISLQYYGSAVAPALFGSGNKLLHNVVGGFGVLEGHGGSLRTGLAWQSVHDGTRLVHDPLRLSVIIEAPQEAIGQVLSRHPQVKALFDHGWMSLLVMNEAGEIAARYAGDLNWLPFVAEPAAQLLRKTG